MTHLTSFWARQYGLPDPAPVAAQIRSADSAAARRAGAMFRAVTMGADESANYARHALSALSAGWSTPAGRNALAQARAAATVLNDASQRSADGADALVTALDTAHEAVTQAYAAADQAIVGENLAIGPFWLDPIGAARLARLRCGVVMVLLAALNAAAATLDAAATQFVAALDPDPRDVMALPGHRSTPGEVLADRTDEAHRSALRADLTAPDGAHAAFASSVRAALTRATRAGYPAELLGYRSDDPADQGSVAVAIGDVARADHVSVLVPGVGNSPMDMGGLVDLAATLSAATDAAAADGSTSATVIWPGYDIPLSWRKDVPSTDVDDLAARAVVDSLLAVNGAEAAQAAPRLGAFTENLRAMMDPSAGLTLIGHSYGSTVVSQSARILDADAGVDDIVLLASPGAGYGLEDAGDYRAVTPDHVYTLAFPADPIPQPITDVAADLVQPFGGFARHWAPGDDHGPFGVDPNAPAFHAEAIAAPSTLAPDGALDLSQHALTNYLSGAGLSAVAAVAAGRYTKVPVRSR